MDRWGDCGRIDDLIANGFFVGSAERRLAHQYSSQRARQETLDPNSQFHGKWAYFENGHIYSGTTYEEAMNQIPLTKRQTWIPEWIPPRSNGF